MSEYNRVVGELQGQTQEEMAEVVQQGRQQLREEFGWTEDSEWNEARERLREYAIEDLGFTHEELSRVTDPRLLSVLEKARRVDEVGADLRERREASKTLKPGDRNPGRTPSSRSRKGAAEAKERVRKTGRLRDGAKAIEGILAADEG